MLYLGIDQHARQLTVSLRDESGEVVQARQVSTQPEKVRAFFQQLTRERLPAGPWVLWRREVGMDWAAVQSFEDEDMALSEMEVMRYSDNANADPRRRTQFCVLPEGEELSADEEGFPAKIPEMRYHQPKVTKALDDGMRLTVFLQEDSGHVCFVPAEHEPRMLEENSTRRFEQRRAVYHHKSLSPYSLDIHGLFHKKGESCV
jgi:hypothetical protein